MKFSVLPVTAKQKTHTQKNKKQTQKSKYFLDVRKSRTWSFTSLKKSA